MEQAVTREEVVHTCRIPGLCRCPGDEQQEEQEEERCLRSHGDQPACLPARTGRKITLGCANN